MNKSFIETDKDSMRILIVSQYYYPDAFQINEVAAELAKAHEVDVITGLPDYATTRIPKEYKFFRKRSENIQGVHIKRMPIIARRSGIFFRMLNYASFVISASIYALFTKKRRYDAIFVYEVSPVFQGIPAIVFKRKEKAKLVMHCCDLWPESMRVWCAKDPPFWNTIKRISGWIYRSCDVVAVSSRPFRDYLLNVSGVKEEKIAYLPHHAEDIAAESSGDLKGGGVNFMFAGNIGALQNIDVIIKAAARINQKHFFVHIVGDGSELNNLKRLTAELGMEGKIIFYGRHKKEAMQAFYNIADCFLLTLKGNDFTGMTLPLKAQSYLSAGKPILGAIEGAGRELIIEADCGTVVPAGDAEALSKAMEHFIECPDAYKQKGENGRQYYLAHFTKDIFMESLMKLLEG